MVISEDRERLDSEVADDLLAKARNGDTHAFTRLVEPLQDRLFRQATALCGNPSIAEDLVSETLVEAWKSLARYNETCRLSTWLYAILLHRHHKWLRRSRSRPISLASLPRSESADLQEHQQQLPSPEPSPAELLTRGESLRQLISCISALGEKHQEVVLLRFFEDASLQEIAQALDCSVGTVKSRLHHALENLRKMKLNLPAPGGDEQI